MTASKRHQKVLDSIAPHLDEGEQIIHAAYGVKQPHIGLIILFIALAIIPGVIAVALMTKHYLVAVTNKRVLILRVSGTMKMKEAWTYSIGNAGGEVTTSTGALFTHITIAGSDQPFKAKFHKAYSPENRPAAQAVAAALMPGGTTEVPKEAPVVTEIPEAAATSEPADVEEAVVAEASTEAAPESVIPDMPEVPDAPSLDDGNTNKEETV